MTRMFPCLLIGLAACNASITTADDDESTFGDFSSSHQDADADADADSDSDSDSDSDADDDSEDGGSSSPNADDDGDGFTNAEEEAAGTNPDYEYSRPYDGGYNVGWCDTPPSPTGPTGTSAMDPYWTTLQNGDVTRNFQMMDQHGEMVDLYSFCGKHVMIAVSAGWCGPCRALAEDMQSLQDRYRDDDLQIIEIIMQDNSGGMPVSESFLSGWANDYGFNDIPVLQLTEPTSYDHPYFWFENDGYIPSIYHLDENMRVLNADGGVHDPGSWF